MTAYHLTLIHPCVGRRRNEAHAQYVRTWKMQPLPPAVLAALAPNDVQLRFFDDRLETIDFDAPTDLVAMSVETYTAKRAYQIASEYRKRGIPVVMGGFHATLCADEVQRYADSIVVGEAEGAFPQLIDDYRHGRPQARYETEIGSAKVKATPDRSIFAGKNYLPIGLIDFARGCRFRCDFCAIQSFFKGSHSQRPIDSVIEEIHRVRRRGQLLFFVDDNIISDLPGAKEFMRALIPLGLRWVSQASINVAFDEEALDLMKRSGCQGVLVGFESLDPAALRQMNKSFNLMRGGPKQALANFRSFGLRVYGTFIFGYDSDDENTFAAARDFAKEEGLFIAAFNHITPFPGTPLYQRLQNEGRLSYEAWWLDDDYRYNMVPFTPRHISAKSLETACLDARKDFYSWSSIARRATHYVHWRDPLMFGQFLAINAMHQVDVKGRSGMPLGDESWSGPLLPVG